MTAIAITLTAVLFLWIGIRLGERGRPDPDTIRIGDTILMAPQIAQQFGADIEETPRYHTSVVRLTGLDRTREGHLILQVTTVQRDPVF